MTLRALLRNLHALASTLDIDSEAEVLVDGRPLKINTVQKADGKARIYVKKEQLETTS